MKSPGSVEQDTRALVSRLAQLLRESTSRKLVGAAVETLAADSRIITKLREAEDPEFRLDDAAVLAQTWRNVAAVRAARRDTAVRLLHDRYHMTKRQITDALQLTRTYIERVLRDDDPVEDLMDAHRELTGVRPPTADTPERWEEMRQQLLEVAINEQAHVLFAKGVETAALDVRDETSRGMIEADPASRYAQLTTFLLEGQAAEEEGRVAAETLAAELADNSPIIAKLREADDAELRLEDAVHIARTRRAATRERVARRNVAVKILYDWYGMKVTHIANALGLTRGYIHGEPLNHSGSADLATAHRELTEGDTSAVDNYEDAVRAWRKAAKAILRRRGELRFDETSSAKLEATMELEDYRFARKIGELRSTVHMLRRAAEAGGHTIDPAAARALRAADRAVDKIEASATPRDERRVRLLEAATRDQAYIFYAQAVEDAAVDVRIETVKGMADGTYGRTWTPAQIAVIGGLETSQVTYDKNYAGQGAYQRRPKTLTDPQRKALLAAIDGKLLSRGRAANTARLNTLTGLVRAGLARWIDAATISGVTETQAAEMKAVELTKKGEAASERL
jgi:hypothetical protein